MLCQFTFKNYKSYKNETTLDMQAVSSQGFTDSLLSDGADNSQTFLPVAVIYGPNAGGKSNVLKAMHCMYSIVMNPIVLFKKGKAENNSVECTPFLFDDTSVKEATKFEIFFRSDDSYEYRYSICIFDNKVVSESLKRKKIGARGYAALVFNREQNGIELGSSIKNKVKSAAEINDNIPFLSFLAINYKLKPIDSAINGLNMYIMKNYADPYSEKDLVMGDSMEFKNKIISLMNDVGIKISGFEFVEQPPKSNTYSLIFKHTVNGNEYILNSEQESDGTQKLFNVLPLVIIALTEGRLLVIDELDAKLHPKLLKFIVMLFKDPKINTKNAQLIFTSHDISTMKSSVFRTDEIWFACQLEDDSSDLYSLSELRDENNNKISINAAFDKQYLEGRYGADPYFTKMMNWE